MQWFCSFLLRGRIVLKLGGNCPDIGGELSGANCPGGELSDILCRRVLGCYDRRKMISALFYRLPSIVSLSIGLACFILLFWGSGASVPIVLALATKAENANVAEKSIVMAR